MELRDGLQIPLLRGGSLFEIFVRLSHEVDEGFRRRGVPPGDAEGMEWFAETITYGLRYLSIALSLHSVAEQAGCGAHSLNAS